MKRRIFTAMSLATVLLGLTAGLVLAFHPQSAIDRSVDRLTVARGEPEPGDDRGRGGHGRDG